LHPRWRADHETWVLYAALPKALAPKERAAQMAVHWSSLPKEQQRGRRTLVSEYQYYMWHERGFDVTPFWVLQGSEYLTGGTPASYSTWEEHALELAGLPTETIPVGMFPPIPFDEQAVQAILRRDRLFKAGNDLERMQRERTAQGLAREEEETEKQFRAAFLNWHRKAMGPCVEFMQWYRHTKEYKRTLGTVPAPAGLVDQLAAWKDQYIETGTMTGAGVAASRLVQVPVGATIG